MNNILSYSPASEIRYAVWLKNLALRLPAYATRYQLPTSKLLELHCIALDFIDLLIHRMHVATGQLTVGKLSPVEETPWDICAALMQAPVEEII